MTKPTLIAGGTMLLADALADWLENMDTYGHGPDEWQPTRESMEQVARLALKALAPAPEERRRVLFEEDGYCPSCAHNRDTSSVSSIVHQDGTHSCQMCNARWLQLPRDMNVGGK